MFLIIKSLTYRIKMHRKSHPQAQIPIQIAIHYQKSQFSQAALNPVQYQQKQ
jgi:hypothetical protein